MKTEIGSVTDRTYMSTHCIEAWYTFFMPRRIIRTYENEVDPEVLVQNLLADRHVEDIEDFLHPKHPTDINLIDLLAHDQPAGYEIRSALDRTSNLLADLHASHAPIVVYTDYDADGVTGGAIMWEALHKLGFNVMPYVPARSEGYGFSHEGIDHVIAQHNPALIISVDHGIVAHEQITHAKQKGVPIIVTDHHHMQNGHPPDAFAVFHTSAVSGAGVAYFFAKHLVESMGHVQNHEHITYLFRSDYVALASIGIIADLVPLVGPSRALARAGLNALSTTNRMGLRELMRTAGVDPTKPVTAYHVGYMIAPRINAFGRLEHAMDALRLLCTTSIEKATDLAKKAETINTDRQKKVQMAVSDALKMVNPSDKVIVLASDAWEEGIIGLIAGKVLQTFYRPTIVMSLSEKFAKASVRSVEGVHITNFLVDLKDYLVDVGGHAAAGGFMIERDQIDAFTQAVHDKAEQEITDEMLIPIETIDIAMPLSNTSLQLARALAELGPFGMQFQNPVFMSNGEIEDIRPMGKTGSHVKLLIRYNNKTCEMISFNASPEILALTHGDAVAVQYTLDINVWNGRESLQGMIKKLERLDE